MWNDEKSTLSYKTTAHVRIKKMKKYLLLQLLSELLGFALLVVVHNHHGSIDLSNGHVTGWKRRKQKPSQYWSNNIPFTTTMIAKMYIFLFFDVWMSLLFSWRCRAVVTFVNGNQQVQWLLREMRPDDTNLLLQVQVHLISILPSWRFKKKKKRH